MDAQGFNNSRVIREGHNRLSTPHVGRIPLGYHNLDHNRRFTVPLADEHCDHKHKRNGLWCRINLYQIMESSKKGEIKKK